MVKRRTLLSAALAAACAAAAIVSTSVTARESTTTAAIKEIFHPAVVWSGDNTAINERAFTRITNHRDWRTLWERHVGDRAMKNHLGEVEVPLIDFDNNMAVVIIADTQTQCRGVHFENVILSADAMLVQYDEPHYATATGFNAKQPEEPRATRPFGIAIVPKSELPITFEIGTFSKETNSYVKWDEVETVE